MTCESSWLHGQFGPCVLLIQENIITTEPVRLSLNAYGEAITASFLFHKAPHSLLGVGSAISCASPPLGQPRLCCHQYGGVSRRASWHQKGGTVFFPPKLIRRAFTYYLENGVWMYSRESRHNVTLPQTSIRTLCRFVFSVGEFRAQGEGVVDGRVAVVKTHFPERVGFRKFEGKRAVLLVRNPFDAFNSYFNFALTNTHTQR